MDSSPTRRRTLQLGGVGLATGMAGCVGDDSPESRGTLDFDGFDRIDDNALPDRTRYSTAEEPFPEYRLYEADDPDIVLILLHTAVFDSRLLQPLAAALADADVAHVFTPDLRGHGPSPEFRGDSASINQPQNDIRYLINRVESMFPNVGIVVGGHGTGGGTAVRFALTAGGNLVDGFVLLAPFLGRGEPTTRPAMGGWAEFYGDRIFLVRVTTGFGIDHYLDMTTVEYDIPGDLWDDTATLEHSFRLMSSYTPDGADTATEIEKPCLTVVGTDDETASPDGYEELFAGHENATVNQIDGASHFDLTLTDSAVDSIDAWIDTTAF